MIAITLTPIDRQAQFLVASKFVFQAKTSPIRAREGNNSSILDLAITQYLDDISSVELLVPFGDSDLVVVLLEWHMQWQENKQVPLVEAASWHIVNRPRHLAYDSVLDNGSEE